MAVAILPHRQGCLRRPSILAKRQCPLRTPATWAPPTPDGFMRGGRTPPEPQEPPPPGIPLRLLLESSPPPKPPTGRQAKGRQWRWPPYPTQPLSTARRGAQTPPAGCTPPARHRAEDRVLQPRDTRRRGRRRPPSSSPPSPRAHPAGPKLRGAAAATPFQLRSARDTDAGSLGAFLGLTAAGNFTVRASSHSPDRIIMPSTGVSTQ